MDSWPIAARPPRRQLGIKLGLAVVLAAGAGPLLSSQLAGAAKATESPLVFGVVGAQTGPGSFPEAGAAMQAYAKYWNAHGGYKGHPIELIFKDVGENPTTTSAAARSLVTQDNVLAMIQNYALLDCPLNSTYYASVPIGVVDAEVGTTCYIPSIDFPTLRPATTIGFAAAVKWGIGHGAKSFGLMMPNLPQVSGYIKVMQAYVASLNKPLTVEQVPLAPTAADFDTAFAAMKAAGVDMVMSPLVALPALAYQEAVRQSFGPANGVKLVFQGTASTNDTANFAGAYETLLTYPWNSKNSEIVAAHKVLKGITPDPISAQGYQAMAVLQEVLNKIKGSVTRASVLQALRHDNHVPLPLTPDIATPVKPDNEPEGGVIEQSKNGSWQQVSAFINT